MSNHQHTSLLFHKVNVYTLQSQIIDSLCYVLVIFGLIGNILGLFLFSSSRRTWRISSIYACLATCSSITNVLCVIRYVFILHSGLRNILYELVGQTWWACKIYEFSSSFRVVSSWITLYWMFERLLCVSEKLRRFFNPCNSYKLKFIIPVMIVIILLSCIIGPPVYMYQPNIPEEKIIDSTMNKTRTYCQLSSEASIKWQKYFHEIRFGINHFTIRCLFSELIPTGLVVLFNSYIVYHLCRTHHRLHETHAHQYSKEQSRTTSWMNTVLLLHSFLFLASLFSHIVGHLTVVQAHEAWWVLLGILINSSINFYIYCLSGKAFRNEISRFIQRLSTRLYSRQVIRRNRQNQKLLHEMRDFQGMRRL